MKINVTQKHIDDGKKRISDSCPIALAIKAATGRRAVLVSGNEAQFGGKKYPLPTKARNFIRRFDHGSGIRRPFAFELS